MICPECSLVNPSYAERCDCGYDFQSRTIEQSYAEPSQNPRPKRPMEFSLLLGLFAVITLGYLVYGLGNRSVMIIILACLSAGLFACLYSQLIEGKNWARIALAIFMAPFGTILMLSPAAKKYCAPRNRW